jgi:hypothetical protein
MGSVAAQQLGLPERRLDKLRDAVMWVCLPLGWIPEMVR